MFKVEIKDKKQTLKADCLYLSDVKSYIDNAINSLSFFGDLHDTQISIKTKEQSR